MAEGANRNVWYFNLMTTELISRTGRVQSWLDNPESRLPVSCTVFVVEDTMEGPDGIEASWRFVSHALRYGAGVAVHLSKIRPRGHENGRGLVASGPVSFAKIYSSLNETLRRGGVFKNGAVVAHLDIDHPDILEFVQTPREELPWIKRCVNVDREKWTNSTTRIKEAILKGIAKGDIWLNKIKYDAESKRIRGNVCLEVYLPSRGTCLLQHVNLGGCKIEDLSKAFVNGMSELCELHSKTGVGNTGEYLPSVTYADFANALEHKECSQTAFHIVEQLQNAIEGAAHIAHHNNMARAFAIAPTASCSYKSRDIDGYTCTPEIAPPIARSVDRDSGTFGVERVQYGDVEIASEVGWDVYKRVADGIVKLLDATGLLHGYSFNSWSDVVTYDNAFIEEWLESPQTSLYYSLQVMGDVQDKSDAMAALSAAEIDDYLSHMFMESTNEPQCDCAE